MKTQRGLRGMKRHIFFPFVAMFLIWMRGAQAANPGNEFVWSRDTGYKSASDCDVVSLKDVPFRFSPEEGAIVRTSGDSHERQDLPGLNGLTMQILGDHMDAPPLPLDMATTRWKVSQDNSRYVVYRCSIWVFWNMEYLAFDVYYPNRSQ